MCRQPCAQQKTDVATADPKRDAGSDSSQIKVDDNALAGVVKTTVPLGNTIGRLRQAPPAAGGWTAGLMCHNVIVWFYLIKPASNL